jgi:glycosyltransferase involved in cell wall biosynthesis
MSLQTQPLLEILIPAHNEEKDLARTIQSIRQSLAKANLVSRIVVAADSCSDRTAAVALALGAEVHAVSFASKWKTLGFLVDQSQSEWVAFVDVGMEWEASIVQEFLKYRLDPELLFIAPTYEFEGGTFFHRMNWALERFLKRIENKAGGPISVHGATVIYRRQNLIAVLDHLKGREWLNDDVIIPLTMRSLYPMQHGLYLPQVTVKEFAIKPPSTDRRFRILIGNLAIMDFVNSKKLKLNLEMDLLWGRRRTRIFWAYFICLVLLKICLLLPWSPWINLVSFGCAFLTILSRKAFRASLSAPYYLLRFLWARWRRAYTPVVKWH